MQRWKRLILKGNRSFELGRVAQARSAYAEALFEAERLLNDWADGNDAMAAYVTTRLNLADLFDSIDEPERALRHLKTAHARLLRLVAQAGDQPARLLSALRHCQRTRTELLRYALVHGLDDPIDADPGPLSRQTASLHRLPRSAAH